MKLRFLGTGTSFGIPVVGCDCPTCGSDDLRDRRTRHGAILELDGRRVLIDTPPELRLQLLDAGVRTLDAVWFTHNHADHTHGMDDLRVFTMRSGRPLSIYGSGPTLAALRERFAYVFDQSMPAKGTSKPDGEMHEVRAYEEVEIAGLRMTPLPVPHGQVEVFGFRVGDLGYITDAKRLPDRTRDALVGVRVLVLNALWFGRSHPTHFNVEEAVQTARELGASSTYLTHISHHAAHRELLARLPPGVQPAHDGLEIEI